MNLQEFCDKNWYILKDKINYDWDRYSNWTVSVTSILKLLHDPKFEFVMQKYEDKVLEACDRWTLVHNTAEAYFNWNLVPTDDIENCVKLNPNVSKFHSLFVKEITWTETRYEKEWVSWTIDLEAILDIRWKTYEANADYKNAKSKSEKYKLQMWWYKWLNWKPWVLVYVWKKLELIEVSDIYTEIFIELKDYFLTLKNWQQ